MMGSLIGLTTDSIWAYHPFIDPNAFGYHTTFPWANDFANSYMRTFTDAADNGDALFAVWAYLLACCLVAAVAVRGRSWRRVLIAAFAMSAVTYQVVFVFALVGPNYRYEFPAVVIGEITIALALCFGYQRGRAWRGLGGSIRVAARLHS
jgi:hypothetical protein